MFFKMAQNVPRGTFYYADILPPTKKDNAEEFFSKFLEGKAIDPALFPHLNYFLKSFLKTGPAVFFY